MDALAEGKLAADDLVSFFNLEIQRDLYRAPYERALFHYVAITAKNLPKKGGKFSEIPKVWVIFICEKDPRKLGQAVYKAGIFFEDGSPCVDKLNILYVNGEYRGDSAIGRLMQDFNCKNPDDMLIPVLAAIVRYYKMTEEGRKKLDETLQRLFTEFYEQARKEDEDKHQQELAKVREEERAKVREEERAKVREEERAKTRSQQKLLLQNLKEQLQYPLEKAAAFLGISVDEAKALDVY